MPEGMATKPCTGDARMMKVIRTDGGNSAALSADATAKGFVGTDACCECGNYTLVVRGTVLKCATCGNDQLPQGAATGRDHPDAHTIVPAADYPAERKGGK